MTLLARAGWDAVHVSDLGMGRTDDAEIVKHARETNRVCVTLDADFHALLATSGASTPSVIRIRKEGLDAAAPCGIAATSLAGYRKCT